ncbi:MAG: Co2+/Mg2+ efflux protein ApaG [Planctomycetota bacterium]
MSSADTSTMGERSRGSETVTESVRISVTPRYLGEHSEPELGKYVFGYAVRVTNERDDTVRLRSRYWLIVDAEGERDEVRGEGVVGEQPRIAPGATYEYASYCPLESAWGTMEGSYTFEQEDGQRFDAMIERFFLVSPQAGA